MTNAWADVVRVLLCPACWLQNGSFSAEWDVALTDQLDRGVPFMPIEFSQLRATIGPFEVWVGNHPYASFTCHDLRPRRATVLRAHRAYCDSLFNGRTERAAHVAEIIRLASAATADFTKLETIQ